MTEKKPARRKRSQGADMRARAVRSDVHAERDALVQDEPPEHKAERDRRAAELRAAETPVTGPGIQNG